MSESFEGAVGDSVSAPLSLPSPGATLRAAREACGYSLAEISQALKFSVRQIEALEGDDYSTLTGATFIRGFVRSYARYLRLDEAPLLAALEPQAPVAVAEVRPVESMDAEMPSAARDSSKRAYWLAAFVLVLGGVAWFAWQEKVGSAPTAKLAALEPATEVNEPAPVAVPAAPTVPPGPAAQPSVAPAPTVLPTEPAGTMEQTVAPAASVDAASVPSTTNANERQLVLAFGGVSWVEIRDAGNKILYSGNSTPDSRQTVRGRPPFQMVIGNAQSVKLRYEDRNIDLQPYTRVDVARLTLDDNTK
ncbi:MAG: helix-turn-helix domain-containing protein [Rhodocyclaceae bacterium]|nr:helix-turn-helix domain-containing protein [Rhodocyclaceae bacterium]